MLRVEATLRGLQRLDERLCLLCNRGLRRTPLLWPLRALSWLGDGIFWYSLMLALLLLYRERALIPVVHLMLLGASCTAVYKLLKHGTSRPRPYEVLREVRAGALALDRFSFPSGHTLHAVAFTLVVCSYYPALAPVLVPFTVLTAASRIALGLHYPSDVLAGAAVGAALAWTSLSI